MQYKFITRQRVSCIVVCMCVCVWREQVGYFWVTLTAMIALYSGIYRVALDLHRRSEEKRRKQEMSLATMAHQTVSHLGTAVIGMTRSAELDAQIILQQQVPVAYTTTTLNIP